MVASTDFLQAKSKTTYDVLYSKLTTRNFSLWSNIPWLCDIISGHQLYVVTTVARENRGTQSSKHQGAETEGERQRKVSLPMFIFIAIICSAQSTGSCLQCFWKRNIPPSNKRILWQSKKVQKDVNLRNYCPLEVPITWLGVRGLKSVFFLPCWWMEALHYPHLLS